MEAEKAQVVAITVKDKLVAIVHHDLKTRHQIFYKVEEMGADEIKDLLNTKEQSV